MPKLCVPGPLPPKENRRPETTGDRPKCLSRRLRGKRTAAAATARRVGILEDEPLAHQVFLPLEGGVVEIEVTLGVHKQPRAMLLEDFVAVARLRLEPHRVRQARAAAALHTHAKPAGFGGDTVLGEESADFFSGLFCQMDHHSITQTSDRRKARRKPRLCRLPSEQRAPLVAGRYVFFSRLDSLLLFPVADGRLDGILGEDGAVNLHRRKAQLAG